MKIKFKHWFFRLPIIKKSSFTGIALIPGRIWLRESFSYYVAEYGDYYYRKLIKHEMIHNWQAVLCGGYINFWILYLIYFLKGLLKYRSWMKAYQNIQFEINARKGRI